MATKPTEEKKAADASVDSTLVTENSAVSVDDVDCSSVLEHMDSCVVCVEGVGLQKDYEAEQSTMELIESPMIPVGQHQSLSQTEAALIRLQIMEKEKVDAPVSSSALSTLPDCTDLALLNICGSEDDMDNDKRVAVVASSSAVGSVTRQQPNTTETDTAEEEKPAAASTCKDSLEQTLSMLGEPADAEKENTSSRDEKKDPEQCAICFDEASSTTNRRGVTFAKLPCCGHADETSTIKICTACVVLLTTPTADGDSRIGRCPRCRSWIVVVVAAPQSAADNTTSTELSISTVAAAGKCLICNQVKDHLVEDSSVCDACFLGRRNPLLYECENCHVTQRIPHPMYRYQPLPEQFSSVTWACHGRCGNFTHWRIRPDQVRLIAPVGDAPVEWGDNYLETARILVQQARQELAQQANEGGNGGSCSIL